MPKYRKDRKFVAQKEEKKREGVTEKSRMFNSTFKAYVVALVFLALSLLFNTELIQLIGTDAGKFDKLIVYGFRGLLVILFFFFGLVAWGNLKELRGSIIGVKEIITLAVMSLVQTMLNGYVFLAATVGVLAICVYIWLMQVKIQRNA